MTVDVKVPDRYTHTHLSGLFIALYLNPNLENSRVLLPRVPPCTRLPFCPYFPDYLHLHSVCLSTDHPGWL